MCVGGKANRRNRLKSRLTLAWAPLGLIQRTQFQAESDPPIGGLSRLKGIAMDRKSLLDRYDEWLQAKLGDSLIAFPVRLLSLFPIFLPLLIVERIQYRRAKKRRSRNE
jgi:hypothetical protein